MGVVTKVAGTLAMSGIVKWMVGDEVHIEARSSSDDIHPIAIDSSFNISLFNGLL